MSGFHVLPPSWSAGATIDVASEVSLELKGQNLLHVQPSFYWQSDGLDPIVIVMDALVAKPWDTLALLYSNAHTGLVEVTTGDVYEDILAAPAYTTGLVSLTFPGDLTSFPHRHTWIALPTVHTRRYIGVIIEDPTNPDGHFRAGVIMVGKRFTPRIGADVGSRRGYHDPSVAIEMRSGEKVVRPKPSKMIGNWPFPKQSLADTMQWDQICRTYGSKIPMVFKWDPWGVDPTLYQQQTLYYGYAQWRSGGAIVYANAGEGKGGLWDVEVGIEEL